MNAADFEPTMRRHLRRRPFQKFIVELEDGRKLLIDEPNSTGFDGGSASHIDADGEIHFFSYDEVREIRLENQEVTS